jgi:hypothetical protein
MDAQRRTAHTWRQAHVDQLVGRESQHSPRQHRARRSQNKKCIPAYRKDVRQGSFGMNRDTVPKRARMRGRHWRAAVACWSANLVMLVYTV